MFLVDALRSAMRRVRASPQVERATDAVPPLPPGSTAPSPSIEGVSPEGSPKTVRTDGRHVTLLFMTSDCKECRPAWASLGGSWGDTVVITPGPETESRRRVAQLASAAPDRVLMSSAAWHSYAVTKAPWVVEVAAGRVLRSEPFRGTR